MQGRITPPKSPEVSTYLATDVSPGDVIVAYQTNLQAVSGLRDFKSQDRPEIRKLWLQPFEVVDHRSASTTTRWVALLSGQGP